MKNYKKSKKKKGKKEEKSPKRMESPVRKRELVRIEMNYHSSNPYILEFSFLSYLTVKNSSRLGTS